MIVARCANQFFITFRSADKGAVFAPRRIVLGSAGTKEAKCGNAGCCGHVHQSGIIANEKGAPLEIAGHGCEVADTDKVEHPFLGNSRQDRIGLVPLAGGGEYGDSAAWEWTVVGYEALCESCEAITTPLFADPICRGTYGHDWAVLG